ncbi:MAG: hypothetical protein PHT76_03695 [Anaerostipes sp.]|nr:hypothetical protein [Anaerostipes sp.]
MLEINHNLAGQQYAVIRKKLDDMKFNGKEINMTELEKLDAGLEYDF